MSGEARFFVDDVSDEAFRHAVSYVAGRGRCVVTARADCIPHSLLPDEQTSGITSQPGAGRSCV